MTLCDMPEVKYPIVIRPDRFSDGSFGYIAEHPDLPGCVAWAATQTEARRLLNDARRVYLADLQRDGVDAPQPSNRRPEVTEWQGLRPTPPFAQPEWKTTGQVETLLAKTVAA